MQKIYVLLRNEKQTGPYSLDEIIQFDLKPYDLIWIEGKSAGWYYPQEIGALHPYLGFLPQKPKPVTPAAQAVFVSMPQAAKTAVLPEGAPVFVPSAPPPAAAPSQKSLEEEVYARFVPAGTERTPVATTAPVMKPRKTASLSLGGGIVAVLVVGGVFAASWILNRHANDEDSGPATVAASPVQNEIATPAVATGQKNTPSPTHSANTRQAHSPVLKKPVAAGHDVRQAAAGPAEKTSAAVTDYGSPAVTPKQEEPAVQKEETPAPETSAPAEKKKKLRDKLFDIFRKKTDGQPAGEVQPTENSNGERSASHREAGANLAQQVHVRFSIPNDWMMGIKGAKATLVNHSSETITKAAVEVLYYDDDNQLLQKKIISFGKVEGKGSQTISIPDHPTATRVDYNVLSATGAGNPAA